MTTRQVDARLAAAIARGRARASTLGELRPRRVGPIESAFTDEAREIVTEWIRDGGYERALHEIGEADPELAVQ
ncbi:MAG TPA: hypothetical protein VNQ73_09390 [Ilumatobacter sp.]|nr:hypothetical protein [Ilumatobacter sp.]